VKNGSLLFSFSILVLPLFLQFRAWFLFRIFGKFFEHSSHPPLSARSVQFCRRGRIIELCRQIIYCHDTTFGEYEAKCFPFPFLSKLLRHINGPFKNICSLSCSCANCANSTRIVLLEGLVFPQKFLLYAPLGSPGHPGPPSNAKGCNFAGTQAL